MEVKLRVADPAGNITIFVTSPVERNLYAKVANELLAIKEFRGEQVGFIERHEDGSSHMEMMGGEFCGNATRSFGYLLGKEQESKDAYKKTVTVDVSGSSEKLDVEVDYEAGTSKTMMPLPEKIEEVETAQYGSYPMVVFDGINHVIVKGPRREDAFVQAVLEAAMAKHKCDYVLRAKCRWNGKTLPDDTGCLCRRNRFSCMGKQLWKRKYGNGGLFKQTEE